MNDSGMGGGMGGGSGGGESLSLLSSAMMTVYHNLRSNEMEWNAWRVQALGWKVVARSAPLLLVA